jgi:uncharacterized protein YecE (DUF72 family)
MGHIRIGTCSWADKTMVEAWYPRSVTTAEARLRYYAQRFDTVEADSPFYGIPPVSTTEHWAARTPEGFVFHVKAYGLMTGHGVDERSLPPELRGRGYRVSARGRVFDAEDAVVEGAFRSFSEAMEPLRAAGRLGGILMQYPPSMRATDAAEERAGMERIARDRALLGADRMLVEFRHASWVEEPGRRERVMRLLADLGAAYVCVDAPRVAVASAMPPVTAVTAPVAYVRFHGRNASTWESRSGSAADRFDYLYEPPELEEWAAPIAALASDAETTFAMFNNCRYDYAPRNAQELARIIGDSTERPDGLFPGEAPRTDGPEQGQLDLGG